MMRPAPRGGERSGRGSGINDMTEAAPTAMLTGSRNQHGIVTITRRWVTPFFNCILAAIAESWRVFTGERKDNAPVNSSDPTRGSCRDQNGPPNIKPQAFPPSTP
jgi:hypothetical protein